MIPARRRIRRQHRSGRGGRNVRRVRRPCARAAPAAARRPAPMTAIPQPSPLSPPPASIVDPLRQVARRHWSVVAARGVLLTLLVSLGVLLAAVIVLSFLPYLPQWARIVAAVLV